MRGTEERSYGCPNHSQTTANRKRRRQNRINSRTPWLEPDTIMCILRWKFFHKLEPDTRSCWRSWIRIRLPMEVVREAGSDTPTLYPDTPPLELLQIARTGYPLLRTEYTVWFFTSSIPPSTFGHLHPLRHHHQQRSCSSVNDCLALPLNHKPSTYNNHVKMERNITFTPPLVTFKPILRICY
ncbi:hypothetical protein VIGAN_06238800 [Vigna angularis var. angularis]|uniref:Uncharacterized protein n=1 Tax=Vigna angularis var. angularis TaxID=157739 RepID=A0A0S3SE15_PHAAN|nr:hypothetical protein VIGAN_06238800 [Vigna angularis var. angularis]